MPIPPTVVRRVVLAPAIVAVTVAVLTFLPLVVVFAAFAVRWLPGRWRGLRLLWFLLVYLVRESVGLVAMFVLWLLSGFGWWLRTDRMMRAHVLLEGWYLRGLTGSARRVLGLRVVTDDVPEELTVDGPFRSPDPPGCRPVLVFSRHAGAGDSFLLVGRLVNTYGRRPRVVLKDLLQFDPCIDTVLNRLPNRFISPNPAAGAGVVDSIAELAAGLEADGALILFPEGGNFSRDRRRRAIEHLHDEGLHELVPLAEDLSQVLPPRPGGALAAIEAAPEADVLFVAHTGLEQLSSLGDLWRGLPMRDEVRMTWWTVPATDVPATRAERITWLYEWWERIDTWIEGHRDPLTPTSPLPSGDAKDENA